MLKLVIFPIWSFCIRCSLLSFLLLWCVLLEQLTYDVVGILAFDLCTTLRRLIFPARTLTILILIVAFIPLILFLLLIRGKLFELFVRGSFIFTNLLGASIFRLIYIFLRLRPWPLLWTRTPGLWIIIAIIAFYCWSVPRPRIPRLLLVITLHSKGTLPLSILGLPISHFSKSFL